MNRIWANQLEKDNPTVTWDMCIAVGRDVAVRLVLIDDVKNGKNNMTAEKFEQITGEKYPEDNGHQLIY